MPQKHPPGGGSTFHAPLVVHDRASGAAQPTRSQLLHQNHRLQSCFFQDFLGDEYDLAEQSLGLYDVSASGDPTASSGLLTGVAGGVYQLKLASTNESETFGFTWGTYASLPGNRPFYWEARLRVPVAITTNQVLVFGLASTITQDVLDDNARNIWFRFQASMALLVELDDNTTDTDDNPGDNARTLTANVFYIFSIEKGADGTVYFRVADGDGQNESTFKTLNGGALDATMLQPVVLLQKSTGATQPAVDVDYIECRGAR